MIRKETRNVSNSRLKLGFIIILTIILNRYMSITYGIYIYVYVGSNSIRAGKYYLTNEQIESEYKESLFK